ncbi:MAG: MarR family transcriptional regulator [Anaerolineales bacterium]|nr:MarR family transcriptional regulator [Anaerolineales bacterium]
MTKLTPVTQSLRDWMDIFMHRSMRGWNQFAKSAGLTMPQFSILMQLHHKGPCGMSAISERFDITNAAASQLVEKLVQGGYLERAEDPSDRRARLLRLSMNGEKLLSKGLEERHRWLDEVTSQLSGEESARVAEALNILTNAAKKIEKN